MARVNKEKFKVYQGVFDQYTLDALSVLRSKGYFDELGQPIKTGKEGDVYLARKGDEYRAVKIYRLTAASFKKISDYISRDYRFRHVRTNARKAILMWVQKEFRNLQICHRSGMHVPYPFKYYQNIIVMEFIEGGMLKDSELENPKRFFDMLMEQVEMMLTDARLIHGDLSAYNILCKNQEPYIIDMGQAMTIKNQDDFVHFKDLFDRDLDTVFTYFRKTHKLAFDERELKEKLERSAQQQDEDED